MIERLALAFAAATLVATALLVAGLYSPAAVAAGLAILAVPAWWRRDRPPRLELDD